MEIKQAIGRNFARRAASYDAHAGVQRLMGHRLLARAADILPQARRILEIGCGTGWFTGLLRLANPDACLVSLDLDAALVAAARRRLGPEAQVTWLVADGETLGTGSFDLIIANASFQWFSRPGATLAEYCRSLRPEGHLAFSTLGPGTFQELAGALQQAANSLELSAGPEIPATRFLHRDAWSDLLTRAGFRPSELVQETLTATFPSVREFLKDLQATGATNPRPQPFSPRFLARLVAAYQASYGNNGSIPVTYDLILAVARK
jgi:malonyl-CoA O-methyltransferase